MSRPRAFRVFLSKKERHVIRHLQKKKTSSSNARTRYAIILTSDESKSKTALTYQEIGIQAGASVPTVIDTLRRYTSEGIAKAITPDRNPNSDNAWRAAEMAGIAEDIRRMPLGMNTIVSEGSGSISGGQRQRLLIARAICGERKILIFDEATSALDNITQKVVADSLSSLQCTRIVVAHRLSTVQDCDRILVLDQGHIIEEGTYAQLMEKNGFFAELVSRQRLDENT